MESPAHPILSERLRKVISEILNGKAPNGGRFCGYCYSPLIKEMEICDHCGRSSHSWPTSQRIPNEVIAMFRLQRSREGRVVRTIAYGGLVAGITVAVLPIAFFDVHWWTATALFAIIIFSYFFFANLANTIGDAIGYWWGQRGLSQRWATFLSVRDSGGEEG